MAKVGNYIQRNYQNKFNTKTRKTWSEYNQAWAKRRAAAAQRADQMASVSYSLARMHTYASQANTLFIMQNQGKLGTYASQTAALARLDLRV